MSSQIEPLACPVCGEMYTTHVDEVVVAARPQGEDGPLRFLGLDSLGNISFPDDVPVGAKVGEGRRHRIALIGRCEIGHRFAIVYTQHKGQTFVENLELA